MRTACVHGHLAVAAGERELRSRLQVEAVEEALVDVDAVLVRGPEDDDRKALPRQYTDSRPMRNASSSSPYELATVLSRNLKSRASRSTFASSR